MKPLSEKQKKFVREYVIDFNGHQAALRAGYNKTSASATASTLLTYRNIQAEIQKRKQKQSEAANISAVEVLKELACSAFLDPADIFDDAGNVKPIHQIPEHARRAIAGIEVKENSIGSGKNKVITGSTIKVKLTDKTRNLELIGRHIGMFIERVLHAGDITGGQYAEMTLDEIRAQQVTALEVLRLVRPST